MAPRLKYYFDEHMPRDVENNLEVLYAKADPGERARDLVLLNRATNQGRILVTKDKGFWRNRGGIPKEHAGIIVVASDGLRGEDLVRNLRHFEFRLLCCLRLHPQDLQNQVFLLEAYGGIYHKHADGHEHLVHLWNCIF